MRKVLGLTAAALCSLFVLAFQLQLLPVFSPLFVGDRVYWPVIYYGCGSVVIGLTLVILLTQGSILRRSAPVLAVCMLAAVVTLTHPLDGVAKNFLVATIFVACATVLAMASAPFALLRLSASATVLSAMICLLDILFSHGFTNSAGRAAGLSVNANLAAGGLLLGAASSFWTVPHRLRGPFLLIVGAGIFATLSRSTLLAAIVICSGVGADLIWTRLRSPGPPARIRWFRSAVLALGLAGWIVTALFSNDRFSIAATNSFRQIGSALTALEEARQSIADAVQSRARPQSAPDTAITNPDIETTPKLEEADSKPNEPTSRDKPISRDELKARLDETKPKSDDLIEEIGHRAENEGDINSISARGLLMERAFLSYRTGPVFGQGLAAAHALQPHNTFLLFAVAFGDLGWIVPIAFLGLTACWARNTQQLPLFLATLTAIMTSHDILLTPGLLAPIVFGIVGLNSLRYRADDASYVFPAMRYTVVTAPIFFAFGAASIAGNGISIVSVAPKLLVFLVFGAITLWSIAVWLWREKPIEPAQPAVPSGRHRRQAK
jgi:hypothetical protein